MQEKSDTYLNFSDRLRALTVRKRLKTAQLARELGVSRTTLYDIKNQKIPISDKMWRKLEEAETRAGIGVSQLPEKIDALKISHETYGPGDETFQSYLDVLKSLSGIVQRHIPDDETKQSQLLSELVTTITDYVEQKENAALSDIQARLKRIEEKNFKDNHADIQHENLHSESKLA